MILGSQLAVDISCFSVFLFICVYLLLQFVLSLFFLTCSLSSDCSFFFFFSLSFALIHITSMDGSKQLECHMVLCNFFFPFFALLCFASKVHVDMGKTQVILSEKCIISSMHTMHVPYSWFLSCHLPFFHCSFGTNDTNDNDT